MSRLPTPQVPEYRVTLFYGPEPVEGRPAILSCVFNVKKRSWKGGVQVEVEIHRTQLEAARRSTNLDRVLQEVLVAGQEEERRAVHSRASELLAQATCALKLDLALERGLSQENSRLDSEDLLDVLDGAIEAQAGRLKAQVLAELDLASD